MKLFGLFVIATAAAASPYHYRQPRDVADAENDDSSIAAMAADAGKKSEKAKKKAAKESGEKKQKKIKKKKIDCTDEALVQKCVEELLQPNETHDDISNYVKCKKTNKKKEQKNHKKEQKKLKQMDKEKYNEEFYGIISQESSRSEA